MRKTSQNVILDSPYALAYMVASAALIGGAFFIAEHQPNISTFPGFVTDIDQQQAWATGGNQLRRIGFIALASFGIFGMLAGVKEKLQWNPAILFALAYVALAGVSFSWSIDAGTSIRRYVVMICCVTGAFGIGRLLTFHQILAVVIAVLAGYLCLGFGAELALGTFQPHVDDYRFAGTAHPNTQSAYLALLCLACVTMALALPQHRYWCGAVVVVALAFLLLTKSRMSCASLPLALGAMWLASSSFARIAFWSVGAVWVFSVVALMLMATGFDPVREYSEVLLMGRQDEASTLTGRLPLWSDLWGYVQRRPWVGYGYAAFWTPSHIYEISTSQEWAISEAHSSYVQTFLELGMVGVLLLVLTGLSGIIRAASHYQRNGDVAQLFLVGGLIFCLLRGFTESGMGSPTAFTMFIAIGLGRASYESLSPENAKYRINELESHDRSSTLDKSGLLGFDR